MSADTPDTAETLARKLVETFWREYVSAYPWANAEGVQRVKTALTDEIAYRLREREQEVALFRQSSDDFHAAWEREKEARDDAERRAIAAESALAEVCKENAILRQPLLEFAPAPPPDRAPAETCTCGEHESCSLCDPKPDPVAAPAKGACGRENCPTHPPLAAPPVTAEPKEGKKE